ncbi:MAG: M23 family metallopeptidase [bacterium]
MVVFGGIIFTFLNLPASAPLYAATPSGADTYLVSIMRLGKVENQFCAFLTMQNGEYLLKSESHHDITISPEIPAKGLTSGKYVFKLKHQNLKTESVSAVGTLRGDIFTLVGKSATDIQLVPQSCGNEPTPVSGWYSPFKDKSRETYASISRRLVSRFGDSRVAGENGHIHAGIDLKGTFSEAVYPIANGLVLALSFKELNGMLLIKHRLQDGKAVYSKYIHIRNIPVSVGQQVTADTKIGRVFDKREFKKSRFKHNHLHLEIRKDYDDKGTDSSYGTTKKMIEQHCYDPGEFLREHLSGVKASHSQGEATR